jgi:hypothetical protein
MNNKLTDQTNNYQLLKKAVTLADEFRKVLTNSIPELLIQTILIILTPSLISFCQVSLLG